jgi:hypothetical protein
LERLGRSVESITRRKDGWEAIVRHDCPPAHLLPIQTKPKNEHEKAT